MSELDNRDWLDAEIGQLTSYHVGREKWAWIATALFAPALVWFGYAAAPYVADRGRIVAAVLIWFLTSSMLALVNAQFCRAWEAANAVSQLRRVRADLSGAPPEARESLGLLEAPAAGRSGFLRALLSTLTFFWRPKLDRRWRVEV